MNVIVKQLLEKSGAVSESEPAAIFMAGLPGAGKTELSRNAGLRLVF